MPQNCNLEGNMMINLWIGGYCPTFSPFPFFGGFKHRSIGGQHPIYIRVILEIKKNMLGRAFGIMFFSRPPTLELIACYSSVSRPESIAKTWPAMLSSTPGDWKELSAAWCRFVLCLWFGNLWNPLESQHWREYHYAIVSWIQSTNPN